MAVQITDVEAVTLHVKYQNGNKRTLRYAVPFIYASLKDMLEQLTGASVEQTELHLLPDTSKEAWQKAVAEGSTLLSHHDWSALTRNRYSEG
jgi:hypothetical protein